MATNTTAELGSKDNPYTMTEYEKLANSGSWKGGYVFSSTRRKSRILTSIRRNKE